MSGWKARRFWKSAQAEACEGGFTVRLDGRAVKTPARRALVVPTLAMAEAIAEEWAAQHGTVRPETMPMTRFANSALDKVAPQFDEVVAYLLAYGGTDLLCYRATGPAALQARQQAAWDPLLDWCATELKAPLHATIGVMHVEQPSGSLARFHEIIRRQTTFQIAAFHDLVTIPGSLVLALAVTHGRLDPSAAWNLSRIDEEWQIEQWGADEDAQKLAESKRGDFLLAHAFWRVCTAD